MPELIKIDKKSGMNFFVHTSIFMFRVV